MNLLLQFSEHLKQFAFIHKASRQLLAVSGGIDSVVLCDLMSKAGYDFTIAHCNFQLRGAESTRDENFVKELGVKYGKQVIIKCFNTEGYAADNKMSIQVAARQLRYNWFAQLLQNIRESNSGPAYLFTAHHANDSIETLLMNFFKGTGISGLHGILPVQQNLVRPLLFAKKEALQQYAAQHGLAFVEDSSNNSDKYTRNFFRQHIIPKLQQIYPAVEDNLLQNIHRFSEAEQLYRQAIDLHKKKLLVFKNNEVHIPVLKLQQALPVSTILFELIKEYGFTASQLPDIVALLHSDTGKYVASSTHRVIKNRKWLIISTLHTADAQHIVVDSFSAIGYPAGQITFTETRADHYSLTSNAKVAALDHADIRLPLLLRRWKPGDYFYPLGLKKKKKLSKFLNAQKLSATDKEKVWVLEMNSKIIWVIGQRIDDRFKIKPTTGRVLIIETSN